MDEVQLLDGLDPAQRHAVTTPSQPLAILAGAGSGKTRVLTRRIAYRCMSGEADPRHVLAVTFTRKAATELDRRLRSFGLRDLPAAGTFHALAYAQLRSAWAGSGQTAPTLLDRKGRILARVLGSTKRVTPAELGAEIEWAKARLVGPATYAEEATRAGRTTPAAPERMAGWYERYEAEKRSRGLVDFDDLLIRCATLIEKDPSFAAAQRWRFRHLFVDEYQDVNPLQERLLRAWLGPRADLCVVGDPNQAIYSWNGADARYLADFARHYDGAEVVELRDNYRSTPQVLSVAAHVLAGGSGRPRPLTAHRADGARPTMAGYRDERDEANGIARTVREQHGPGQPWSAQAVLVRVNAQTAPIEQAFRRAAIPYRVRGGHQFLDDPDVRDLLSRFERLREPLVTTVADLDASTLTMRADLDDPDSATITGAVEDSASGRRLAAYEHVVRLGRELLAIEPTARTDSFPGWVRSAMRDDSPTGGDAVTISTFHAAKGLEWDVVHLAGLEAGLVPITHARTPAAHAEEQRLFYVAVTRAESVLSLSWAQRRTFGSDSLERTPSPYLNSVRDAVNAMEASDRRSEPTSGLAASRAALAEEPPSGEQATPGAPVAGRGTRPLDHDLAERLRAWRSTQARRAGVQPTVVLSDRALDAVARHQPTTTDEFAGLPGIGPITVATHGDTLLAIVSDTWTSETPSTGRV